jgi:hypothetical protein
MSTAPQTSRRRALQFSLLGLLGFIALAAVGIAAYAVLFPAEQKSDFDGQRAYGYLVEVCKLGRRLSGSEGMAKQQELLKRHFEEQGGKVSFQKFRHKNDPNVEFANLIVQWHPETEDRVLLCAHYDTRPYPDMDPKNPRGTFIGANDGGSGVAVLMELGQTMPKLASKYGIDFVLFDAEEYIFQRDGGDYSLGAEYFARQYAKEKDKTRGYRYTWGVLLDMIGDSHLQIYKEKNSLRSEKGRQLVRDIWAVAERQGVREFYSTARHEVTDDHLPLNNIARIPTCDIIDFDYPYWHTEADLPDRCSAESLGKVGRVVLEWLRTAR